MCHHFTSYNNIALTDFGSSSELQSDSMSANDAKQKFWWRQNSYRNQKLLQETNILRISVAQVFFKNQIISNPYFALKCILVEFLYV